MKKSNADSALVRASPDAAAEGLEGQSTRGWNAGSSLIEADQEDRGVGRFGFVDYLLTSNAIVVRYSHSHPPTSGWTRKL